MSRFMNTRYGSLEAYVPGEQPRDMVYIKLNTNESPYPPASQVVAALDGEDIENLRLYSDPTGKILKEKLARLHGVAPENIFLSNGSDDALNYIFMAYGEKGAAFPDISYGFYPVYAQLHGIDSWQIPLKEDFSVDYRDYCGVQRLVVIANPNAPTGMSITVEQIEKILRSNPDSVVVIDEAYVDFGGTSCYPLIQVYENLLVVRTFSKSRCLAGGRLGWCIGSAGLIEDLEKLRYSTNPYNINRLTLRLGEATVDADSYYQDRCRAIIRTREDTAQKLQALGFRVLPSQTNFLFASSPKIGGRELYLALKERGILVRHFSNPRISDFVRITIGTDEQMERFIQTVETILGG